MSTAEKKVSHTPGLLEVGQHPAMTGGAIIRPVLMGKRTSKLPECEGGHVVMWNEADAHRLADCWNACEGLDDPADLRRQRDVLMEACRFGLHALHGEMNEEDVVDALDTAITNATREQP